MAQSFRKSKKKAQHFTKAENAQTKRYFGRKITQNKQKIGEEFNDSREKGQFKHSNTYHFAVVDFVH